MNFYFFIFKKLFINIKKFYIRLYQLYLNEEVYSKMTFSLGKPRDPTKYVRRRKIIEKKSNFEKDKENLLKNMEKFYYTYGTFVNTYGGSLKNISLAWNYEIWTPMRNVNNYIDKVQLVEHFPLSSPSLSSVSSFESLSTLDSYPRALRHYRPFHDSPSTTNVDNCKICMTNKKMIGFFPCGHIGICNSCCKNIYKKFFKISNKDNKAYLMDTLPLPLTTNTYETIEDVIYELTQPRFHHSKKCVFCKEKIESFKIMYSV